MESTVLDIQTWALLALAFVTGSFLTYRALMWHTRQLEEHRAKAQRVLIRRARERAALAEANARDLVPTFWTTERRPPRRA